MTSPVLGGGAPSLQLPSLEVDCEETALCVAGSDEQCVFDSS